MLLVPTAGVFHSRTRGFSSGLRSQSLTPLITTPALPLSFRENDLSKDYYTKMLTSAAGGLHALTFHDYGDDCCVPTAGNVLNVSCLDALLATPTWLRDIGLTFNVSTWNGEGALHSSSGVSGLTNTAVSTLYYLHSLGSYASLGFGLFSRQTLVGGDYELVNRSTFLPTPDYFGLLLFRKLVDGTALNVSLPPTPGLRAHSFCALGTPGGVVVLLINFAATSGASVSVAWPTPPPVGAIGDAYTLQGVPGWVDGDANPGLFRLALNNVTLIFDGTHLPHLSPVPVALDAPLWLSPASATFVVNAGAGASACA